MPRLPSPFPGLAIAALAILAAMPAAARQADVAPAPPVPATVDPVLPPVPARPPPAARPSAKTTPQEAAREAQIIEAAEQVLALIDAGQAGEVWDGASGAIRRIVPREEFVWQVARDRESLGRRLSRGEPTVRRERFASGGPVPQGDYLNVAFATRFAGVPAAVRELVSFRFDEDQVWRVSGYSLRGDRAVEEGAPDAQPAEDAAGAAATEELIAPPAPRP